MKKYLLSPPHMTGKELIHIQSAFDSNWIAPLGPNVDSFEKELALYNNIPECLATSSGTSAIHLALHLLNVGADDIVFCSSFTFIASINPALYLGARPVFIDSEWETWGMSPEALEKALQTAQRKGKLPKAIIVVHIYGQPAQIERLVQIANSYGVPIIEDAAEALGAEYDGQKVGTFGEFGIFSFNGNKIITTSGGGALIGKSSKAIQKARFLSAQAKEDRPYYYHKEVGYNYRLSNVLAGIGIAQLEVLNERISKKQAIFNRYKNNFKLSNQIEMMPENESKSNYWLTTICLTNEVSDTLLQKIQQRGLECRRLWKPLHTQPLFKGVPLYQAETKNVSEYLYNHGLCLPSGTMMSDEDVDIIAQIIEEEVNQM